MSDMTCHDSFIGHGTSDGSHVHFQGLCSSHDKIQHSMMWHNVD